MVHYFALYGLVFMMGFLATFDGSHRRKRSVRMLRSINFLSTDEIHRLRSIWEACQDS